MMPYIDFDFYPYLVILYYDYYYHYHFFQSNHNQKKYYLLQLYQDLNQIYKNNNDDIYICKVYLPEHDVNNRNIKVDEQNKHINNSNKNIVILLKCLV